MNKRQAKIKALKIISGSPLIFSDWLSQYDLSEKEKEKVSKEIDSICNSLERRALNLERNISKVKQQQP